MLPPLETYEQAIEFLFGRINYERAHVETYSASDLKLDRMQQLLQRLGNPHERLPALHVAGTKGKGSTCNMLAAVLTAAGYRTGLFTSPHLVRFEERMTVDGVMPTPGELVQLVNQVRPVVAELDRGPVRMHPTYFELATALAWLDFLARGAEAAVLETGLGGRLDSTSLCRPWTTVITNVSRDHTQILGSTVGEIAAEKAGIVKPGVPVISGAVHPEAQTVIARHCASLNASLWLLHRDIHWQWESEHSRNSIQVQTPGRTWTNVPVMLRGEHQAQNTALAVAALDSLQHVGVEVTPEILHDGLSRVRWPGRVEVVGQSPRVVLDAAHNWESARALLQTLNRDLPAARRRILVFATTRDKDYRGLIRQLVPEFDTVIFTRYVDNPRSIPAEELARYLHSISDRPVHLASEPYAAWKLARRMARRDDLIVITGSLFLVGELRDLVCDDLKSDAGAQEPVAARTIPQGQESGR